MLQISEIVKKTEEMFDLFNEHFCNKELICLATIFREPKAQNNKFASTGNKRIEKSMGNDFLHILYCDSYGNPK